MERVPTREELEEEFRRLLEDGGILCLWHGRKVSVVIELDR